MVVYGLILHVTTLFFNFSLKSIQKFGVSEDTLKLIKKWQ